MILFWKISLYVSIVVFILFLFYLISIKFHVINVSVSNLIAKATFIFFIYGTFLEMIQIPICIVGLFFKKKPKRVWLFFLMMATFFIIKALLYVYILGSGL